METQIELRNPINSWDPRFVLELAIGVDSLEDILDRYGIPPDRYSSLVELPAFRRELAATIRDVRENGATFKAKARVQAESYLEIVDELVYSEEVPAGVRLDAIKSLVKWGGLEPKEEKDAGLGGQSVNIQINF